MTFKELTTQVSKELEKENIIFFSYGGWFTQTLIASLSDVLEKECEYHELDMSTLNKLFVVFVEVSQNIMKYSPPIEKGIVAVASSDDNFKVFGYNMVTPKQKEIIEQRLGEIAKMDIKEIKKRYRDLRKSGAYSHEGGGGIGFYEIAKKSDDIEYSFIEEDDKIWFLLKVTIKKKLRFDDEG